MKLDEKIAKALFEADWGLFGGRLDWSKAYDISREVYLKVAEEAILPIMEAENRELRAEVERLKGISWNTTISEDVPWDSTYTAYVGQRCGIIQ